MGCWWIFTFLHVASYLSDLLFIFDDEMLEAFGFVVCAGYNFFAIHNTCYLANGQQIRTKTFYLFSRLVRVVKILLMPKKYEYIYIYLLFSGFDSQIRHDYFQKT